METCTELSIRRQCELVGIARSSFYYEPVAETPENLALMRRMDELHVAHPVYGSRRLTLEGETETRRVVIIEFPTIEKAKEFYHSDEYRDTKHLRKDAATAQFLVIDGCAA